MIHVRVTELSKARVRGPGTLTLMHLQQALADARVNVRGNDALNLGALADFATDESAEMRIIFSCGDKQISAITVCITNLRVPSSHTAMTSASPLDVATVGCADDHVRMTCSPTFNTPPLVDFLSSRGPQTL